MTDLHLDKYGMSCGCDGKAMQGHLLKVNLDRNDIRHETLQGEDYLVVPVVMLKNSVVMNETLVPADEIYPIAWNGVPVTIQHPQDNQGYLSANSPDIINDWAVGTIYNARLDGGSLKAEAWVNVARANELDPTLLVMLTDPAVEMDVSTGFFSDDEDQTGEMNGRVFTSVAHNINPDHLALLPGKSGACSWEDGCGIRANERKDPMADDAKDEGGEEKVSINAFTKLLKSMGFGGVTVVHGETLKPNRRGDDGDYRQMVADLISNETSPFVPADEDSLRMMSYETLISMRDAFAPVGKKTDEGVKDNSDKEADVADKEDKKGDGFVTATQVADIVANALKAALPEALKANSAAAPALSDEDKAALSAAKEIVANARKAKVDHIKANTEMTDDELKTFSDAQLEVLASRIKAPVADYAGRGFSAFNEASADDEAVKDMTVDHVAEQLKALSINGKAN